MISSQFLTSSTKTITGLTLLQKCIECSQAVLPIENSIQVVLPQVLKLWFETRSNPSLKNKASETIVKFLDAKCHTVPKDFAITLGNFIRTSSLCENWRDYMELLKVIKFKNKSVFQNLTEDVNLEISKIEQKRPQVGCLIRQTFNKLL